MPHVRHGAIGRLERGTEEYKGQRERLRLGASLESGHLLRLFQLGESRVQLGEWPAVARGISSFSEGGGVLGALTKALARDHERRADT